MKKFILFVSTVLCAACTNTVSQNIQLSKDEGIAVFKLDCPERYVAGVDILPSGMKPTGSTGWILQGASNGDGERVLCWGEKLLTVKFKAGDYYLSKFAHGSSYLDVTEDNALKFKVKGNTLNYIGNLKVTGHTTLEDRYKTLNRFFIDKVNVSVNKAETEEELTAKYPELYKRYSLITAPASYQATISSISLNLDFLVILRLRSQPHIY